MTSLQTWPQYRMRKLSPRRSLHRQQDNHGPFTLKEVKPTFCANTRSSQQSKSLMGKVFRDNSNTKKSGEKKPGIFKMDFEVTLQHNLLRQPSFITVRSTVNSQQKQQQQHVVIKK